MEKATSKSGNKMPQGMGSRVAVSILTFFGSIIGIIVWLFFYAGSYSVYQNIAIVVVVLLGFMAVMGATWASWGMRQAAAAHKRECEEGSKGDDYSKVC